MKVLIDINIILDVLLKRDSFFTDSYKIFNLCISNQLEGYLSSYTFPTIWYLLKNDYPESEKRRLLECLLDFFEVISPSKQMIKSALSRENFSDFEDCLQDESAINTNIDYIITRNTKDYKNSKVKAIEPKQFLSIYQCKSIN